MNICQEAYSIMIAPHRGGASDQGKYYCSIINTTPDALCYIVVVPREPFIQVHE